MMSDNPTTDTIDDWDWQRGHLEREAVTVLMRTGSNVSIGPTS